MENNNYPQYFKEQVSEVFKSENLKCISDDEVNYHALQLSLIELYRKKYFRNSQNEISIDNIEFIDDNQEEIQNEKLWKLYYDIEYCSSNLMLFTANLYLLRPTINNPLLEKIYDSDEVYYTYHQNFSDWNYSAIVSCCYEKLYNYWDRIGDVLALYLDLDIKNEHQITFAFVIDWLEKEKTFSSNENFMFLKFFKENEYKEFNKIRREVVHYNQFETTYRYDFIFKYKNNEEKIIEIWKWKKNMPEYFKKHLELSLLGYKHCVKFVEEHFNKNL